MNIIELTDTKWTPDAYHEYSEELRAEKPTLVIDNGSYKCRVGWSCSDDEPLLEFRNLIAKPRKDRKKDNSAVEAAGGNPFQIGNDITNIEAVRQLLKTQFDRNIVTHFPYQEQMLDYIFSHLSIETDGCVEHPVLLTEALANPIYCRQQISELFFECYGVPGLCYGVDSLFSWQRNCTDQQDALIISFGYHTTHVIPVLDGHLQADRIRRLSVGGFHIITYLFRLMQMKYPVHLNAITISRMETLLHQHGSIAVDYQATLKLWAQSDYYAEHVKRIQLAYTAPVQSATLTAEQKLERRKELAKRLIESNARRAKEKLQEDEEQLEIMQNIRQLYEDGDTDKFKAALRENKLSNLGALDKLMGTVRARLERTRQKLLAPPPESGTASASSAPAAKEKAPVVPKPPAGMPLNAWLAEVKEKREAVLKRKQLRKTRRQDMAKRHTVAAQERMRIISQLARHEKGTDEFGMNDNDWDVYKVINRDNEDSDSEAENEKLLEYENVLRHHDPNFEEPALLSTAMAEHYQLHAGVECLRAPELLFQPSMIGSSEAGLAELIDYVLKLFTPRQQLRLANNVYMTGGCSQFPGLQERLSKELLEMRPFQTPHHITVAEAPDLDAWLGAKDFANSHDFNKFVTTKSDYEEKGADFFRTHSASNLHYSQQQ